MRSGAFRAGHGDRGDGYGHFRNACLLRCCKSHVQKRFTWGGLRGGLSLALAVSLPDSDWKPLLLNMTFATVVFSIVVQGLTIRRLFTKEQLAGLLRDGA